MPSDECGSNDEEALQDVDGATGEWLAVFHYPYRDDLNQTFSSGTNCHTVLDRVCTCALQSLSHQSILPLSTAHCFCFFFKTQCLLYCYMDLYITFLHHISCKVSCAFILGQESNDVWCFCYYHTGAQSKNH